MIRLAFNPEYPGDWLAALGVWRLASTTTPATTLAWDVSRPGDSPAAGGIRTAVLDGDQLALDDVIQGVMTAARAVPLDELMTESGWAPDCVTLGMRDGSTQWSPWLASAGQGNPIKTARVATTEIQDMTSQDWAALLTDGLGVRTGNTCKGSMLDDRWRTPPSAHLAAGSEVDLAKAGIPPIPLGATWLAYQALPLFPLVEVAGKALCAGWSDRSCALLAAWAVPVTVTPSWSALAYRGYLGGIQWAAKRQPRQSDRHKGAIAATGRLPHPIPDTRPLAPADPVQVALRDCIERGDYITYDRIRHRHEGHRR